jgi:hypothetical protein
MLQHATAAGRPRIATPKSGHRDRPRAQDRMTCMRAPMRPEPPSTAQSRRSLESGHAIAGGCGDSSSWTCSSAGFPCHRAEAKTQRREGIVGPAVGDVDQGNVSTTGRHAQRNDIVDTPRALQSIGECGYPLAGHPPGRLRFPPSETPRCTASAPPPGGTGRSTSEACELPDNEQIIERVSNELSNDRGEHRDTSADVGGQYEQAAWVPPQGNGPMTWLRDGEASLHR